MKQILLLWITAYPFDSFLFFQRVARFRGKAEALDLSGSSLRGRLRYAVGTSGGVWGLVAMTTDRCRRGQEYLTREQIPV